MLYLAVKVILPYAPFLILAFTIAYTLKPYYNWLLKKTKRKNISATLAVLTVIIVIFIPLSLMITSLASQGYTAITTFDSSSIDILNTYIQEQFDITININTYISSSIENIRNFFLEKSFSLLASFAEVTIGLVIMFFVLFYSFRDGQSIYESFADAIPIRKSYKRVLVDETKVVINAVLYGQIVTALIQGFLGGLGFFIFGVPNPIFWGTIMALLALLPVIGTPLVFIPAIIFKFLQADYNAGIMFALYNLILVMNIDNIIKPFIISEKAFLNPATILIGVLGGIKAFGFIGFILGPLVLALFKVLLKVFKQDFKPSEEVKQARKQKLLQPKKEPQVN